MLVAIVVVSLIASGYSLPLEEGVKEQAPQTAVQEILVQDAVKADEVVRDNPPYPIYPGNVPLPPPVNLPEPVPGNNVQVLPEILPPPLEGGLSQPEGPQQVDGAEDPALVQGGNAQDESDLKTDSTFWGYGGGWGYRSPYYGWGGYYSNPYRRWGGHGYGRGYGGWGGRGYGGGWGWSGGYRRGWGGGYWG